MARGQSKVLTDHDEIRRWAEERRAAPACVRGTGGSNDIGMLRLDFPGFSGADSLEHITWDEWFRKFDERSLALLVQDQTARGEKSNFNKLIGRETAAHRERGTSKASRRSLARGRAVIRRTGGKSTAGRTGTKTAKGHSAQISAPSRKTAGTRAESASSQGKRGASGGRTSKKRPVTVSAKKSTRGSTRAKRTESARGRTESRRKAA
jgi:hypothetical protein